MNNDNTYQLLVDRLDGVLSADQVMQTDTLISHDEEVAEEWKTLNYTVRSIREAGVYLQVGAIRANYEARTSNAAQTRPAVVRTMSTGAKLLRIAAILIIVLASATAIKYASVSNNGVYNKYYETYELNTVRSQNTVGKLEALYREKNWQELVALSNTIGQKSNKEEFLTGIASMELKQYDNAIGHFKNVLLNNKQTGNEQFTDEAQYYLAMSYLAEGNSSEALPLFDSIKNDPSHVFNQKVKNMNLDIRILRMK